MGDGVRWLKYLYDRIFSGAGRDIRKPEQSSKILGLFDWLDYYVLTFLDWFDTKVFFKGRRVRTRKGRVRSFAERRITRYFDKLGIEYVYEKELVLDGKKIHPDFYLPKFNVYVEFWGMVYDPKYRNIMAAKMRLYAKHKIPVISLDERCFRDLETIFPKLFKKVTGKEFPLAKIS